MKLEVTIIFHYFGCLDYDLYLFIIKCLSTVHKSKEPAVVNFALLQVQCVADYLTTKERPIITIILLAVFVPATLLQLLAEQDKAFRCCQHIIKS